MDTPRTYDDFLKRHSIARREKSLEHYGVKGMRWGVRRSDKQLARAAQDRKAKKRLAAKNDVMPKKGPSASNDVMPVSSDDYTRAANAKKTARTLGTKALSNQELQDLNNRMNLERQYAKMNQKPVPRYKEAGKKFLDKYIENEVGALARGDYKGTTTYKAGNFVLNHKIVKKKLKK